VRYVIIGAGAIGGVLAARLAQHSADNTPQHPPIVVARGEHGAAIARDGIRLRSFDADVTVPVEIASGPDALRLRADDVLVVTTKTQDVQAALGQWVDAPVFDADGAMVGTAGHLLPLFTATNGVASERIALRYFARVFGVVVWLPAVRLDPGEIILRIGPASGEFIIGRYPEVSSEVPLSAADAELLRTLETDWTAATFVVHVVDDVMRWKYAKLLGNLGNSIQALVGPVDGAGELADRVRAEALEVYAAAGIDHASEGEERAWRRDHFRIHKVPGEPATMGGSSWQSLARGSGSIESDYLNGEIAVMARTVGRSAPLNATLQRVAREAAKSGAGAGSMTLAELEAQLEAELAAQPAAQLEP